MKIDIGATTKELILALEEEYSSSKPRALVSIMTSSDGDFFSRMCHEEGGGIEPRVASFFKERPIGKRVSFSELLDIVKSVETTPRFASLDGSVVIDYGLHIWISNCYITHNPVAQKSEIKKMTIIDRLFHPVKTI